MLSDDTLLLLNRATLATHTVRTAVHELNNILQMVGGYAELLQDAPDLPDGARRRIDAILRQTGRGQAILQTVTDLTRPVEAGAGSVSAAGALQRVLDSRRYEHTRAGITVTVDAPAAVRLAVPPAHVDQMLLNLVLNAEQAVGGQGGASIAVRAEAAGDRVVISVADSGPGASPDFDPLEPFATSRPGAAAGLGLTASRVLAQRYGGTVEPFRDAAAAGWRLTLPAAS